MSAVENEENPTKERKVFFYFSSDLSQSPTEVPRTGLLNEWVLTNKVRAGSLSIDQSLFPLFESGDRMVATFQWQFLEMSKEAAVLHKATVY